jgi:hypothetical protein
MMHLAVDAQPLGGKRKQVMWEYWEYLDFCSCAAGRRRPQGRVTSQGTAGRAGDAFAWREIDVVRVKGPRQPVRIYEPFELALSPAQRLANEAYDAGLKCWRAAAFAEAADHFVAAGDKPASLFAARARRHRQCRLSPLQDHASVVRWRWQARLPAAQDTLEWQTGARLAATTA